MPFPQVDRSKLLFKSLKDRHNKVQAPRDMVSLTATPRVFEEKDQRTLTETIDRILAARKQNRSVMLAFGAHSIKNGLGPVLIRLIKEGWVTHLATNGAGIIHDWELAFQGATSEDVRANVPLGEFGTWEETGFYLNLAIAVGAFEERGYGESVGALIANQQLSIPSSEELVSIIHASASTNPERAAAAADLLSVVSSRKIKPGPLAVLHPFQAYSVQAAAFRLGVPFTGHPMIGHDIIYTHPMNHGGAIGRAAQRDFLTYAEGVSRLSNGVYLSVGSAVMSPMIFEKSLSMAQNMERQRGQAITSHFITVVDLAESRWDWSRGEPPADTPDYYHRFCKTFSRMGGTMRYLSADNRDFMLALYQGLHARA